MKENKKHVAKNQNKTIIAFNVTCSKVEITEIIDRLRFDYIVGFTFCMKLVEPYIQLISNRIENFPGDDKDHFCFEGH